MLEKLDRILVKASPFLVLVTVVAVPAGIWAYQTQIVNARYPAEAEVIDLTAHGGLGLWTRDFVYSANYWGKFVERTNNIRVSEGDLIVLRLRSADVVHGFAIPGLDINAGLVKPGKVNRVKFRADKPGAFTFRCTQYCTPLHPAMSGTLTVVDQ